MFTVPSQVTNVSVYMYKEPGFAQFYADTLALIACEVPEELPATAAPEQRAATPVAPTNTPLPVATPVAPTNTPLPATAAPEQQAATPVATTAVATPRTAGIGLLTEYVDPDANLSCWLPRRLAAVDGGRDPGAAWRRR